MMDTPDSLPHLDDRATAFLSQEIDRFLGLYSQAQNTVQTIFNFYLTFATAITGGIFFVLQGESDANPLTISGLLLLAAIIGSVYLSALSGRYAQAARYAYLVDELRRFMIGNMNIPTPVAYSSLLREHITSADREGWWLWLFPTGTYQLFIALINSTALAVMVLLLAAQGGASSTRGIVAALLIFVITLTVYNAYSRLTINRFNRDLHARLDIGRELTLWASRQ